jgi:hypothetical protein
MFCVLEKDAISVKKKIPSPEANRTPTVSKPPPNVWWNTVSITVIVE